MERVGCCTVPVFRSCRWVATCTLGNVRGRNNGASRRPARNAGRLGVAGPTVLPRQLIKASFPLHRTRDAEPSPSPAPIRVSASAQPLQNQGFLEVSNLRSTRTSFDGQTSSIGEVCPPEPLAAQSRPRKPPPTGPAPQFQPFRADHRQRLAQWRRLSEASRCLAVPFNNSTIK